MKILQLLALLAAVATVPASATSIYLPNGHFKSGHPLVGETLAQAIRDPATLAELTATAQSLKSYPDVHLAVEGHAGFLECSGHECLLLSHRRAELVHRFLIEQGVPCSQIQWVAAYGVSKPIVPKGADASDHLNNRVELNLAY